MNHLEFAASETKQLEKTGFEYFAEKCEKLCKPHLNGPHNPGTFDEDGWDAGYSLDWLYDQYEADRSPEDILKHFEGQKA